LGNGEDSWGGGSDDWARRGIGDGSALGSVQGSSDGTGNGRGLLDGGTGNIDKRLLVRIGQSRLYCSRYSKVILEYRTYAE